MRNGLHDGFVLFGIFSFEQVERSMELSEK